ncbi:MAG: hypothetical protein H6R00_3339 [Proteobacteria bacterium]|nr:hypothetical protein [Pseudomonadota bacterium]
MRLPSLALAIILATPAFAGIQPPEPVHGPIRVIDGDTVRLSTGEIIRIYDIDAPETHKPRCPAEKIAGESSAGFLGRLLDAGGVMISRCEVGTGRCRDRYGRTLATLSTRDVANVGDALIGIGLALPWKTGKAAHDARARHWCGGPLD